MGRVRQLEGEPTDMVGQKLGPSDPSNTTESVSSRSFNTTGKLLLPSCCCGSKLSAAVADDDDMLSLPPK